VGFVNILNVEAKKLENNVVTIYESVDLSSREVKEYRELAINLSKKLSKELKCGNVVNLHFVRKPYLSDGFIDKAFHPLHLEFGWCGLDKKLNITNVSPTTLECILHKLQYGKLLKRKRNSIFNELL
jgi:hypothetical protein